MIQFPNVKVLTVDTDKQRNEALDDLLGGAGVKRVGRLTVVTAFREELAVARKRGRGALAAADVIIVGTIVNQGSGSISASHVGNEILVSLAEQRIAYPLGPALLARAEGSGSYPASIGAVTLGYGAASENGAYERATQAYDVYPLGGGAPARMEYALAAAAEFLHLE